MPIPEFKLGADPELGIIINGRMTRADRVVQTWNAGRNQFGLDGAAVVAEIRPAPAIEPSEFVENIRRCLRLGAEHLWPQHPRLRFKAGSMAANWPIGGHIHIGCAAIVNCHSLMGPLSLVLDTFLAPITLLLDDPRESTRRRGRSGYGKLGDHREQPWGMEYRTPGSWITSPAVSMGIMSLVRILTHDFFEHGVSHDVIAAVPDAHKFAEYDAPYFTGKLVSIHDGIQKMSLYPRYTKEVEFLFALIQNHCSWFPGQPMLPAWGLVCPTSPTVPVEEPADDGDDIDTPEEGREQEASREQEAPIRARPTSVPTPMPVSPETPFAESSLPNRSLAEIWGTEVTITPPDPTPAVSARQPVAVVGATPLDERVVFAKRMADGSLNYLNNLVSGEAVLTPFYYWTPQDSHNHNGFCKITVHASIRHDTPDARYVAWARDANGNPAYYRTGDMANGFMMVVNQAGATQAPLDAALRCAMRLREECDIDDLHVTAIGA